PIRPFLHSIRLPFCRSHHVPFTNPDFLLAQRVRHFSAERNGGFVPFMKAFCGNIRGALLSELLWEIIRSRLKEINEIEDSEEAAEKISFVEVKGTPLAPFFICLLFSLKEKKRHNDAPRNDVGIKGGNRFNWTHRETLIGFRGFGGRFCFSALDRLASFLPDGALSSAIADCKGGALLN
ncbi:hypothetical protein CEXT_278631, partial [Caerostris extrusa]